MDHSKETNQKCNQSQYLFWEFFFTQALADGFSQEFQWQLASSSLQNIIQYSSSS